MHLYVLEMLNVIVMTATVQTVSVQEATASARDVFKGGLNV